MSTYEINTIIPLSCHWVFPECLDAVYGSHSQTPDVQKSNKYLSYFVYFLELRTTFIRTVVGAPTISKEPSEFL